MVEIWKNVLFTGTSTLVPFMQKLLHII